MKQETKWDQAQRFRLIEIVALWEGRLTTNHLCSAFRIGRQQASRDINRYLALFKEQPLELDRSIKGYKPSLFFQPRFSQGTVDEYLNLLHHQNQMVETFDFFEMGHAQSEVLNVPSRVVSPLIVRRLLQAARELRRVDIDYVSLSTPEIRGRNIVPHTLVNDGFRWHVRAFCEDRLEYRDFVLSRFRNEPELLDRSIYGRELDDEWNTFTTIIVTPNPFLSAQQHAIICEDYGMKKGVLCIETRAALVKYVIERLNICVEQEALKTSPAAHQLTVKNLSELQRHLI